MADIIEVDSSAPRTLQQIADNLAAAKKILVVTGAGISTSCGIPDFRSQGGLYSLAAGDTRGVHSHGRPASSRATSGKDMFDASVWQSKESRSVHLRFISNLKRASSEVAQPSPTHKFVKLLRDQRRLVRNYTQNIDGLEKRVGLCADLSRGPGSRSRFTKQSLSAPTSASCAAGTQLDCGCEAVPLHGDLEWLRCPVCQERVRWTINADSQALEDGEAVPCPACATRNEVRLVAGRRGSPIGALRPNIVLYGEEHPSAGLLEPLIRQDLQTSADILLILGTSLKVHGLQKLVKEFAKAVHSGKRGIRKVIYVNRTAPSRSVWKGTLDYFVKMDCDEFVERLRQARPDVWGVQLQLPYQPAKPVAKRTAPAAAKLGTKQKHEENQNAAPLPKKAKPGDALRELDPEQTSNRSRTNHSLALTSSASPGPKPGTGKKRSFEIFDEDTIVVTASCDSPADTPKSAPSPEQGKAKRQRASGSGNVSSWR